jgi:ribonuclease R
LFVELTGYYVQGLVHISELGADYFRYSPTAMSLVGDRSGRRFGLGDRLRVRLVDVQPAAGKIDLVLAAKAAEKRDRVPDSGKGGKRRSRRG